MAGMSESVEEASVETETEASVEAPAVVPAAVVPDPAPPVERVAPVVTVGDAFASVAFGDQSFELDAGQVHRLRRDLDRAFMELS